MRFAFVPFVVLVCSSIYAQNKIDASHVTSPVYVVNLPDVQAVTGTVSVDNLPAVQAIGGTVNVGNLPLAPDGALRVSTAPAPPSQMVWYELLDAPADICAGQLTQRSVNTDGYSMISVRVVIPNIITWNIEPIWQFADDEFLPVTDFRDGLAVCQGSALTRLICRNVGGNVKVRISGVGGLNCTYPVMVTSIRVYLIP